MYETLLKKKNYIKKNQTFHVYLLFKKKLKNKKQTTNKSPKKEHKNTPKKSKNIKESKKKPYYKQKHRKRIQYYIEYKTQYYNDRKQTQDVGTAFEYSFFKFHYRFIICLIVRILIFSSLQIKINYARKLQKWLFTRGGNLRQLLGQLKTA